MILYFSGTGNSRWAAQLMAHLLDDPIENAFPYLRRGQAPQLHSHTPWVFVCPTYAWRLPPVFELLLREGQFYGNRDAYFIMTCGDSIGGAEESIRELCLEKNLRFRGVLPVQMPENYVALFPVPEGEQCVPILRRAEKRLRTAAPAVPAGEIFPPVNSGWKEKLLSGPVNSFFHSFIVKDRKFFTTDGCTGCGQCEQTCPVNNILLTDGRPVWQKRCMHCMACICGCPQQAIEYGKKSQGKPRYQCVPWQEGEERHDGEAL